MVVVGFALVAFVATSCSNSDDSSTASGSTSTSATASASASDTGEGTAVAATVQDFEITVDPTTASAGEVNFTIANDGPSTHEFVVVKTDVAPDALPTADGEVTEDGLDVAGEAEDIAPSTTATLSLDLDAGSYVIMCNITGHYQQGMNTGFTVS